MLEILPSILAADFARLGDEVSALEEAGCRMLHVDVMDGHFVPNISIGPVVVAALRKRTRALLDVHLMISDPDKYVPAFIDAGADLTMRKRALVQLVDADTIPCDPSPLEMPCLGAEYET